MNAYKKCTLSILLILGLAAWTPAWAGAPLELSIIHINDSHSHFEPLPTSLKLAGEKTYLDLGGVGRLAAFLDKTRAQAKEQGRQSLFLHAGDAVQGTLYFIKYKGRPEMEFLNWLKLDAFTLGNHEFDKGPDFLARMLGLAEFPVVAANTDAAKAPALAEKLKPFVVKDLAGAKVGIFGLITPATKVISSPGPLVGFGDPAQIARRCVAELMKQGVNKIIALTHQGYQADLALAKSVDNIDVIVGGHSHTLLGPRAALKALGRRPAGPYPTVVEGPDGQKTYVAQADDYLQLAGVLNVSFDAQGRVLSCQGDPVYLAGDAFLRKDTQGEKKAVTPKAKAEILKAMADNPCIQAVTPDRQALARLAPYTEGLAELRQKVVAKVAQKLYHVREPGQTMGGVTMPTGSQVAPYVCASMLAKVRGDSGEKVDMALMNGGGIRASLPAGDLTVAEIYTLLPFDNTLVLLDLSGARFLAALENGVGRGGGAWPYLAGGRYTVELPRPKGKRILKAEVARADGEYAAIDPKATYRIVTNSYLAGGGDAYAMLGQAKEYRYDTGFTDAGAFLDYVEKLGTLTWIKSNGVTVVEAK